eukprot:3926235-Amphidinium_carterae.2
MQLCSSFCGGLHSDEGSSTLCGGWPPWSFRMLSTFSTWAFQLRQCPTFQVLLAHTTSGLPSSQLRPHPLSKFRCEIGLQSWILGEQGATIGL